jgi:hypothetical protein
MFSMLLLANDFQTSLTECNSGTIQELPILSEYYDSARKYNMMAVRLKARNSIHRHLT